MPRLRLRIVVDLGRDRLCDLRCGILRRGEGQRLHAMQPRIVLRLAAGVGLHPMRSWVGGSGGLHQVLRLHGGLLRICCFCERVHELPGEHLPTGHGGHELRELRQRPVCVCRLDVVLELRSWAVCLGQQLRHLRERLFRSDERHLVHDLRRR